MLVRVMLFVLGTASASAQGWPYYRWPSVAQQITDARVLGTLGAGDVNQIESARLGATKGSTKDVREYAKMMLHDHEASFKENTELARRFRITRLLPIDSAMARTHKQSMDSLNLLTGAPFDRAFLVSMVADHAALIKQVDSTLLPAAERREVKDFLRELLPILSAHLAKGQRLMDKPK